MNYTKDENKNLKVCAGSHLKYITKTKKIGQKPIIILFDWFTSYEYNVRIAICNTENF